ncbi:hypothetical protein E3N88_08143 [Mikania micrantha]|uniref:Uncharacterized protein n=1 Tax=Mikania micrantha TaxID=192012 RepID=A0A5N6PGF7_9ASTR|nr:hypothetical protein E3N88_08143 [Mikania micrantha]
MYHDPSNASGKRKAVVRRSLSVGTTEIELATYSTRKYASNKQTDQSIHEGQVHIMDKFKIMVYSNAGISCEDNGMDSHVVEVNLAAETALCRGSNDCTHPSSDGHLSAEKRGTGEAVDLDGRWNFGDEAEAGDLGMEADMKADLRFEIDDLFTNLLHLEAIANIARLGI